MLVIPHFYTFYPTACLNPNQSVPQQWVQPWWRSKMPKAMKRKLKDVAEEKARELRDGTAVKKMKCENVVDVLTRQHNNKFTVAANDGTRSNVCTAMRKTLGEQKYEAACLKAVRSNYCAPELPTAIPDKLSPPPSAQSLRKRFPSDATTLLTEGAQRIKELLTPQEVATVVYELSRQTHSKPTQLSKSLGNGHGGSYVTLEQPLPEILERCREVAMDWVIQHAGPLGDVKKAIDTGVNEKKKPVTVTGAVAMRDSKTLLLRYGLGGENYAHHDACGDFQALLILSQPGVDYTGGAFYLGNDDPPFQKCSFPFDAAGDLLVFRGREAKGTDAVKFLHGMEPVMAGSGEVTRRFAVGFFQ